MFSSEIILSSYDSTTLLEEEPKKKAICYCVNKMKRF